MTYFDLTRLRIAIVGAIGVVLAMVAFDIFDRTIWALLLAPVIPSVVAIITSRRSGPLRLIGAVASVVAAVAAVVLLWDGSFADVGTALTSGVQRLISTEWPSPTRPDLLGTTAAGLALSTAVAAELARHQRWHVLPLLPQLVAYMAIVATSAPGGVQLGWLIPLGLLAILLATLRPGASLRDRAQLLRGERRLVAVVVVTGLIAIAVSIPLSLTARADPRTYDAPDQTAAILEPIEAMLAIQDIDPPEVLHRIVSSDQPLPNRWRTAALDQYDGRRWAPAITIRPLGRTLGPADDAITYDLYFLDEDVVTIPLPGSPVSVDALIQTDLDRTIVRLDEQVAPDEPVRVRSNRMPDRALITADDIGRREVDETVSGLTDFAENLASDEEQPSSNVLEQLQTLERRMRDDFALDREAPGGGLQRALIDRFLRDTQRGNVEQFATAFVLLARSLGIDARVATGFVLDATPTGPVELSSADVAIWPEVRVGEDRWIAFDPVPTEEVSDAAPPPEEEAQQSPAAPQPPVVPPPDPENDTQSEDDPQATVTSDAFRLAAWAWVLIGAFAIVVVPLLLVMLIILGIKRRRRRRRLGAPSPIDRVRGAWALATDALVDAGQRFGRSSTDHEIALESTPLVAEAGAPLERLAVLASAATFGTLDAPEERAAEAAAYLNDVEDAIGDQRTRSQRLRWRLSLRSLRHKTRSPVLA